MKQIRLLPVVVLSASALLILKTFGILSGQGYILGGVEAARAVETTPAVEQAQPEAEGELSPAEVAAQALFEMFPGGEASGAGAADVDATEAVILQRLAERRAELDGFAAELETRLAVVEAAEMRIEERMAELSAMEAQINALIDAREEAEAEQFAAVVAMYENMRAGDAATIFNDLDREVLVRVGRAMNPRKLGPIIAQMVPAKAQELTVMLAEPERSGPVASGPHDFANLPQIIGQ